MSFFIVFFLFLFITTRTPSDVKCVVIGMLCYFLYLKNKQTNKNMSIEPLKNESLLLIIGNYCHGQGLVPSLH